MASSAPVSFQLPPSERTPPPRETRDNVNVVLRVTLLLLLGAAFVAMAPLWAPVLLAAWCAIVAKPLHQRLAKRVGGRSKAAGVITVLLVVLALAPLVFVSLSLFAASTQLIQKLQQSGGGRDALSALVSTEPTFSVQRWDTQRAIEFVREHGAGALGAAVKVVGATTAVGVGLFVFVFGFYTFLVDGRRAWDWMVEHSPLPRPYMHRLGNAFAETGRGMLVGVGATAALQGLAMTVGFLIIAVPQALVLGLITAIAALIPSIGTALVWVPVAAALAMSGRNAAAIATVALGMFVSVVDNLLRPWLSRYGQLLLPTFVLFLAMLGGIAAFGAWGVLLGPLFVRLATEALGIWRDSSKALEFPDTPGRASL
jgi:predicted PurR-regulated permease PerM